MDIVLLTSCVETLSIVATDDKDKASLRVESCEVRSSEKKGTSADKFLLVMVILKHPVTADVVLVPSTNAKDFSFIGNQSSTELRNQEIIEQDDFLTNLFVYIIKVNVLGAPFKVVDKFSSAVALLQNEGIVKELRKFGEYINVGVVSYSARKLSHLSFLRDKLLRNGVKISPNRLKAKEVKLMILVRLEMSNLLTELVKLTENLLDLFNNLFLLVF